VFLPVLCALLLIVFLPVFANHGLWMTSIPIVLEAVFFILETGHISVWWVKAVSILLYIVISIIYTMTVFGKIPSKWPLVISIGVPLVYHLAVQDRTSLLEASSPNTLVAWMPEISAMSFVLALLLITLAMVKKVTTYGPPVVDPRADLAQIRDLKYVPEELEYHSMIKARREKKKAAAASTEPAPPLPEGEELLLEDPEEIAPPTPSYEDES
jgi:signal transduction histidine kinase